MGRRVKVKEQWVVVVGKISDVDINVEINKSCRNPYGDWACFIGTDKDVLIEHAIKAKLKWEGNDYGPYELLVGKLTGLVKIPTNYKVVEL